jgi:hypothetical protein
MVPTLVPTTLTGFSRNQLTPDLSRIIDAWPSLPSFVKAGVLALVEAAKKAQKCETGRP